MYQRTLGNALVRVSPSTQLIWALLLASSALLFENALRVRPDPLVALVAGGLVGVASLSIPALSASAAW
jgi:hypothetical protein